MELFCIFEGLLFYILVVVRQTTFGGKKKNNQKPIIGSTELPQTGYYVMRQGWNNEDQYMVISAGLTPEKPV
ncbi:MAG: hypothetical protein MUC93_12615 [Bacteroidales bacterium]|nr:hypothetical protein [Bacteroidales bacterium]